MIYVTSSESGGISMPYCVYDSPMSFLDILLVWHIVTLPLLLSWNMINFTQICSQFFSFLSAEKIVESHLMWPWFVWLVHGVGGDVVANRMDLMDFWSNKFRFSKRFLGKPTVKSALETSEWRADGSVVGISIQLLELLAIWRASRICDGWLARPPAKSFFKIIHYDLFLPKSWPFFKSYPPFISSPYPTWFQRKTIIKPQQPSKVTSLFLPEFFSSHSSVRDFPVLGCSRNRS